MGSTETKNDRLSEITRIVSSQVVSSQEELMDKLSEKGYFITQATLSRDIKELKLVKTHTATGYRYQIHAGKNVPTMKNSGIISVDAASNLVVIKTGPGFAGAIASAIDNNVVCDAIMGTIAGDDTILLILRSTDSFQKAIDAIAAEIPNIKNRII